MTDRPLAKYATKFTNENSDYQRETIVHDLGTEQIIVSLWDERGVHVIPLEMRTQTERTVTLEIGSNIERVRAGLPEVDDGTEIEVTVIG